MSVPVREYMTSMPHTIGHDMGLNKAAEMMKKYSCHHLPVLDGGQLVGVISDRDLAKTNKINVTNKLTVEDIMTEEPITVDPAMDVYQVAILMHEKRIGSVIVSPTEEEPWGIFTATDALRFFTREGEKND